MKVGILTFQWANNYGALLQAYGLCEEIKGLGHEVRVINYVPPGNALRWWQGWGFHRGRPLLTLKRLRFDRFRRCDMPLTRPCRTMHDLRSLAAKFDAVIVGSDQVWNGHIVRTKDVPYFLGFVDRQQCRLISYAACFGESSQPTHTISAAGPLLRRFDDISVRDEMSAALVRELSGRDAEIVVDPTLLHDYRDVALRDIDGPGYIAVYSISQAHITLGRDIVREVRNHLRLPVVTIGQARSEVNGDRDVLSAGPWDWLRLLQGATFICTDSFHGTVMAVKLAKPFIAWSGLRSERIRSLLGACGTQNRLVDAGKPASIEELLKTRIDYDAVSANLSTHIVRSRAFLAKALSV